MSIISVPEFLQYIVYDPDAKIYLQKVIQKYFARHKLSKIFIIYWENKKKHNDWRMKKNDISYLAIIQSLTT